MATCNIRREQCFEDDLGFDRVEATNAYLFEKHGIENSIYFIYNGEVFMLTPPGVFRKELSHTGFNEWDLIGSDEIVSDMLEFEPVAYPKPGEKFYVHTRYLFSGLEEIGDKPFSYEDCVAHCERVNAKPEYEGKFVFWADVKK